MVAEGDHGEPSKSIQAWRLQQAPCKWHRLQVQMPQQVHNRKHMERHLQKLRLCQCCVMAQLTKLLPQLKKLRVKTLRSLQAIYCLTQFWHETLLRSLRPLKKTCS
jgi:hypothetical protein